MIRCIICDCNILTHARFVKCNMCNNYLHSRCIPYYQDINNEFTCENCLHFMFPFNNIEDDRDFISAISGRQHYDLTLLNNMVYSPLSADDQANADYIQLFESDPDVQFYNESHIIRNIGNCKYYNEDFFSKQCNYLGITSQRFSLIHFNIRSLPCHFTEMDSYLKCLEFHFTVIGLSETWLNDNNCSCFSIEGYRMECINRTNRQGGGVSILIQEQLDYTKRSDLCHSTEVIECIFIEVFKSKLNSNKHYIIGVIYRPPNSNLEDFNNFLNDILANIQRENKYVYLLGDFNIDLLNSNHHNNSSQFIDTMYSYSLFPLINKPTRVTTQSKTLIDNIFSNDIHSTNLFNGILLSDISDHFPVFSINVSQIITDKQLYITTRNYNQTNIDTFTDKLANFHWNELYAKTNAGEAFTYFHDNFLEIYNSSFPKKCIKIGYKNRKTWLTNGLKISIKHKNYLYTVCRKNPSQVNDQNYKEYKRILTKIMRFAEKQYYYQLMNKYKSNIKKSWQILKNILNMSSGNNLPSQFKIGNKIEECPEKIADAFNRYYVNVGPKLASKIPIMNNNPLEHVTSIQNSIFINETNSEEIISIIKDLKISSPGHDDIDIKIVKKSCAVITEPLTYLFNLSLNQGHFPDELKVARVTPIYKSDDPSMINNYRPVSVLPVFSKILEKIMLKRLNSFFEQFDIFYNLQFGFRSKHNTSLALIYLIDLILQSINNGEIVLGVLIDYCKAFDTVNHNILLNKLNKYGVRGIANTWLKSYLSNRKQFTSYNKNNSSYLPITCGVPQGSILGPFLFLCYINDLPNVSNLITPLIFADDTNLFIKGKDPDALMTSLNEELIKIANWTKINKLSLNTQKTKYIVFTRPRTQITIASQLRLNNDMISQLKEVKFLGVFIDNKLRWNIHISHICKKISKSIGIICKAKNVLDRATLRTLYFSFIHPHLTYAIEIWGKSANVHVNSILRLQKKALRIITSVNRYAESAPIFHNLKILTVYQIYHLQTLLFLYKFTNGILPSIFGDFFQKLNSTRETRNDGLFRIPLMKNTFSQRSLRYQGALIWNTHFNKLQYNISFTAFKKRAKQYILLGTE